jgi:N-terminal domain of anti-restriction factor ArdC
MSSNATTNITAIDSKKPATKQELIAANIKLLIEQLEAGKSDALTNYLTAMSRFHNYSFGNVLEIARQMPTATRVAGFWAWKNLGRFVNAGEKGIRILAPIVGVRRKKDKEAEKDITKQNERVLLGFRKAYVFDISQTNGVDLPAMHEVSGDPGENIGRLAAFLKAKGIQLVYSEKITPALGMSYDGRIPSCRDSPRQRSFRRWCMRQRTRCCTRQNAARQPPRPCANWKPKPWPLLWGRPWDSSTAQLPLTTSSSTKAILRCWPRAWK